MTAHAMACDALASRKSREIIRYDLNQLNGDIAVHAIVSLPWFFGGVQIETSSASKVIGIVLARKVDLSRRRVRTNDNQSQFGGVSDFDFNSLY